MNCLDKKGNRFWDPVKSEPLISLATVFQKQFDYFKIYIEIQRPAAI